ncbi:hypothetical protein HF521_018876 [Silurus meridionalis]|uniref:Dickkopf N-terminal cysteine-rich domain-containing protein n=1 Tax=Silurus meridionalis TaxID=175797 RepID=A0A8T0BKP9_SILME|nr:hypothetical protein HF521_018876 [Silurus meridionalis]
MLLMTLMSLWISLVRADQRRPSDLDETLGKHEALGQLSLNEMFREVEKLMEDTQQKLEEAVHQMANETSRSFYGHRLPFRHSSSDGTRDMDSESSSGDTFSFTPLIQESRWNEVDHECLIDEDCEENSYCLYNISSSKCVLCKSTNMECVKDEECCGEQLCVWGVCTQNKTRGDSGTICQYQSDCSHLHCCAVHKDVLQQQEGESCEKIAAVRRPLKRGRDPSDGERAMVDYPTGISLDVDLFGFGKFFFSALVIKFTFVTT